MQDLGSFFRQFITQYRKATIAVTLSILFVAMGITTFAALHSSANGSGDPLQVSLQFPQLPWAKGEGWKFQTGPHNLASSHDLFNGLDFVDQGDKSVHAVADGKIIVTHIDQTTCGNPSCASQATYVIEQSVVSDVTVDVKYWHLAAISRADGGGWHVGDTVHADDQLGIEGGTGFSIPAGFVHLWLAITDASNRAITLATGTISFDGWVVRGDSNTGLMVRGSQNACAANDNSGQCLASDNTGHIVTNDGYTPPPSMATATPSSVVSTPTPVATNTPVSTNTPPPFNSTPTSPPPVTTPGTDSAVFTGQSNYPTVDVGQSVSLYFTLQNNGSTTWSDSGGYSLECVNTCLGPTAVGFNGQNIGPGQSFTFNFTDTAPGNRGLYRNTWAIQHNSNSFGPGLWIDITVRGWDLQVNNQFGPSCNNQAGENWASPLPNSTIVNCDGGTFHMRQTNSASPYQYAESDMKTLGNGPYDQTHFYTQVQLTFENPGDSSTWGAVIVQTPRPDQEVGGYIFAINPSGQWRLQQVLSGTNIPVIQSGSVGGAASYTVEVMVANGQLSMSVNGQNVGNGISGDTLGSDAEMGLMVEKDDGPVSSTVQFNDFTFATWD